MAITSSLIAHDLWVNGDVNNNTITLGRNAAGTILVNNGAVPIQGGPATTANTWFIHVAAGAGADTVTVDETNGALPNIQIQGGDGADTIRGSSFADSISGEIGNDDLSGGRGDDLLSGDSGDDWLWGENGNHDLRGGSGRDVLTGGSGDDWIFGGDGDDRISWSAGDGNDIVQGDAGFDILGVNGSNSADHFTITPSSAGLLFYGVDSVPFILDVGGIEYLSIGTNGGDDLIEAGNGLAAFLIMDIDAGAGNDTIVSGDGGDTIRGDAGIDTVSYATSAAGVAVDLSSERGWGGNAEWDRLVGIENLIGSTSNDVLTGNNQANVLDGGAGDDTISGEAENDTLKGGSGADTLAGGTGDNMLFGDDGDDTAVFLGAFDSYTVQRVGESIVVTGADSADTLTAIEHLRFADITLDAGNLFSPCITSNGGGDSATVSVAENATAVATVAATDADPDTNIAYSIVGGADAASFRIDSATGVLSFITAPDFEARADADRNNSYAVQVRASDGGLFDTQTVTVNVTDIDETIHLTGTPGDDTAAFDFRLIDATVTYSGSQVIIDGPSSRTVLTGFEVFNFTDGTVNNNDGDLLVDDLFYYSHSHDVWNAHVDADQHYHQNGWHEWRDPSAFFDTSFYLATNSDVKASGIDPLVQFHRSGWMEGRAPSAMFDAAKYLAANPDVAAAHVDPLAHFLQSGAQEGRQPVALTELIASNGFDYVYYLQHNPDVAAAHVDPFQHFQTSGWKEGRNPNALFDTQGYLAAYTDVAAAGINPLDHYHSHGWLEGRDPSKNFDTSEYLAHYQDVAAAHIDPLVQLLQHGIHEGRSMFADGQFG